MKDISKSNKQVAECIGLWLAEGDTKSKLEITFTNTCFKLVNIFYKILVKLFDEEKKIRIYTYSKNKKLISFPNKECIIKNYQDSRARRSYYIVRLTSVEKNKKWKEIVEKIIKNEGLYESILRGFFAGEGNIKLGSNNSRVLRIAQKNKNKLIENILDFFNIKYKFRPDERNYVIYGKKHWDIFAKLNLADLHPEKKEKFWKGYNEFKEEHYDFGYLLKNIYCSLDSPKTARELSTIFNRSLTRIQDVLIDLKKKEKIWNFRVGSKDYWTNESKLIIISKLKKGYLLLLESPKKVSEMAKHFGVDYKSSYRRIKELKRLGLVKRKENKEWIKREVKNKVLAI